MNLSFSFIIPVFNRPQEIGELLESLVVQTYDKPFEIVIVEDGSTIDAQQVVERFENTLNIAYERKPNSGPGDSRNYGMQRARGNYFIVLDSDCILPPQYLVEVEKFLQNGYVHCFGGPDAAHESFTSIQKAINYAMTSVLTTGGIRGHKRSIGKFQPRSFNMGISKNVFEDVGGYGNIHPGEDPDLTIRIWNKGYDTKLIPEAFVYHKRRIDWHTFSTQVTKFGMVRPILNKWHPSTAKIIYWLPTLFCVGLVLAVLLVFYKIHWPIYLYLIFYVLVLIGAFIKNKSFAVALLSLIAVTIQMFGYGYGFLKSTIWLNFSRRSPEKLFPKLFFKIPNKV